MLEGFDEAEIPTVEEIKLGFILFGFCFAFGGLLTLFVLTQLQA